MMINYRLEDAKIRQDAYVSLFRQYCAELLLKLQCLKMESILYMLQGEVQTERLP